jgi:O-antigen/teichoic acid export membrane protein
MRNLKWLVGQQGIRLISGFFIGSWMARSLGPENFGLLGASHAVASIAYGAVELGLRPMVQRELSARPRLTAQLAGTAFWIWLLTSTLVVLVCCAWNASRQPPIPWLVFIAALVPLLCFPFTVQNLLEEAEQRAFVSARNQTTGFTTGAILRVGSLLWWAQLPVIAWTICTEAIVNAILGAWIGIRRGRGAVLTNWSSRIARVFLSRTGWLALYQIANMLILRLDTLLLEMHHGPHETGIYSAAVRLSEIGTATCSMLTMILLPKLGKLVGAHQQSQFQRLAAAGADLLSTLGILCSVGLICAGPIVLQVLFGSKYEASIPVLTVHGLSVLTYFLWDWRNSVLIYTGSLSSAARMALGGVALNLGLNLWLIPSHGAVGAAWATVLAYGIGSVLLTWLLPQHRWLARCQLHSLFIPLRWLSSPVHTWHSLKSTLQA